MLLTPLVEAGVNAVRDSIRTYKRKRELRQTAQTVDAPIDDLGDAYGQACGPAAVASAATRIENTPPLDGVSIGQLEPSVRLATDPAESSVAVTAATDPAEELLARMTLAPQPQQPARSMAAPAPSAQRRTSTSALATTTTTPNTSASMSSSTTANSTTNASTNSRSHAANTSAWDQDDYALIPASRANGTNRGPPGGIYNPHLPAAPWYLSPTECHEYQRIQTWAISWGMPAILPSATPQKKGFSWRRPWESRRTVPPNDGTHPRFMVNADGHPDPNIDYSTEAPAAASSSFNSIDSATTTTDTDTRGRRPSLSRPSTSTSSSSNPLPRTRSPSPAEQTWSGVSVHSNTSITFRKRISSALGYGGRTVVADKPVNGSSSGHYFEVLVSEFGLGKVGNGVVTTVGLGAEGSEAVDLLVERMLLTSSNLTREEAREIAEVVVREEEETRRRIRRAVGMDGTGAAVTGTGGGTGSGTDGATAAGPASNSSSSGTTTTRRPSFLANIFSRSNKPSSRPPPPPNPMLRNDYKLCLGLVSRPYPPMVLPGFFPTSVALVYSPYEGCYISATMDVEGGGRIKEKKIAIDESCIGMSSRAPLHLRVGDTIGVGYDPSRGCFFTVNGRRLDLPTKKKDLDLQGCIKIDCAREVSLFPAIGSNGPCQVLANFGAASFIWDGSLPVPAPKKKGWNQTFGDAVEGEIGEGDLWLFGEDPGLSGRRRSSSRIVYSVAKGEPPGYKVPEEPPPGYEDW